MEPRRHEEHEGGGSGSRALPSARRGLRVFVVPFITLCSRCSRRGCELTRALLSHRFSTTTRILFGFLLTLAAALFFFLSHLTERVQRQYLEAAEEPMVDAAHVLASIIEQHVNASGQFDLATIRTAFAAVRERRFEAQIYDVTKTSVNLHAYITDRAGIVVFDSNDGLAEGQNFRSQRDVAFTLIGG